MEVIGRVNACFGNYFSSHMGMESAGEVLLDPDPGLQPDFCEFDKFGVQIRVKFRDVEQLQDLNAQRQSGGERSVSTMLFLLALQVSTVLPHDHHACTCCSPCACTCDNHVPVHVIILTCTCVQGSTACPFRVVDEINQGMDPVNERHIFNLIVQSACNGAQYLLLTPKVIGHVTRRTSCVIWGAMGTFKRVWSFCVNWVLFKSLIRQHLSFHEIEAYFTLLQLLQNLEYSQAVAVHMVNNGQEMVTCDKWDLNKMLC